LLLVLIVTTGLGFNWYYQGVSGSPAEKCPYTGIHANREYKAVSGCNAVPLEQEAAKAACNHWDEECLVDELMTGVLRRGSKPMLSRITVGSLQDLGYKVNYNKADKYGKANLGPGCTCPSTRRRRFLAHGDTLHLGQQLRPSSDRTSNNARLKISASAYQLAMEYGQALLAQRAAAAHPANRHAQEKTTSSSDDAVYVGHKVVSVLVYDQDEVYGVVVHR
jgi:Leishmanolysin